MNVLVSIPCHSCGGLTKIYAPGLEKDQASGLMYGLEMSMLLRPVEDQLVPITGSIVTSRVVALGTITLRPALEHDKLMTTLGKALRDEMLSQQLEQKRELEEYQKLLHAAHGGGAN